MKNHFELFGLAPAFALDPAQLGRAYREIQSKVHPDRFARASDAERRASMQMTAQINEAYRTLTSPVRRAKYILELNGVDVAFEADTAMPKEFLIEQMELREQLEQAQSVDALRLLQENLSVQKKSMQDQVAEQIDVRKNFAGASGLVRKLMFLDRLGEEIDAAYDTLEA